MSGLRHVFPLGCLDEIGLKGYCTYTSEIPPWGCRGRRTGVGAHPSTLNDRRFHFEPQLPSTRSVGVRNLCIVGSRIPAKRLVELVNPSTIELGVGAYDAVPFPPERSMRIPATPTFMRSLHGSESNIPPVGSRCGSGVRRGKQDPCPGAG